MLDSKLLRRIGESCYGRDWCPALAYDLGMNARTVERMAAGQFEIPPGLNAELRELVTRRSEMANKLMALYTDRAQKLRKLERELNGGAPAIALARPLSAPSVPSA